MKGRPPNQTPNQMIPSSLRFHGQLESLKYRVEFSFRSKTKAGTRSTHRFHKLKVGSVDADNRFSQRFTNVLHILEGFLVVNKVDGYSLTPKTTSSPCREGTEEKGQLDQVAKKETTKTNQFDGGRFLDRVCYWRLEASRSSRPC